MKQNTALKDSVFWVHRRAWLPSGVKMSALPMRVLLLFSLLNGMAVTPSFAETGKTTAAADVQGNTQNQAITAQTQEKSDTPDLPPLNLKTVLLNKATREKIDQQRADYLNPPLESEQEIIKPIEKPEAEGKGKAKPKKPTIYLPYKLSVTAVIKKADGSALVRLDNKYNATKSKYIWIDQNKTGPDGVHFEVLGKEKTVPVGQTLYPRTMKTVENYVIEQQEKKAALPKTQDKATENRLQEVQMITGE